MIRISVLMLLILSGCCTAPEDEKPEVIDQHLIWDSQNWMERNTIETWIEGKWIQTEGILPPNFMEYLEFSYRDKKGKWIVAISPQGNSKVTYESSYKIEINYWGNHANRLVANILEIGTEEHIQNLFSIEIGKANEDEIKVYHRGFDINNLPSDFDWANPDPKLAVRTGGDDVYAIYQRVK